MMNKIAKNKEDILIKKFNLKEARVNLTPCDKLAQNTLALQPVDAQTDVDSQQTVSDGIVYVASDCINGEFVNIFCPSQEGGSIDQTTGLNLLISSELINADGSIVVQQGEYLGSDCIFLPVTQDQTIQVIGNSEILSDATEKIPARVENTSNISTTGFLICSDPSSSISLTSEANLQNDVMLGQIIAGATKGSDDDDLVGELRNFLPKRNESMSDIANDIPEYGMDWNGGELDWSLEQSAVNEGVQTSEADKLNEEFSKRMREEFAASFINKNSLIELKKKIGNVKCLGKKDRESEEGSKEKNLSKVEKKKSDEVVDSWKDRSSTRADHSSTRADHSSVRADHSSTRTDHLNMRTDHSNTRTDHKRKSIMGSESSCKRLKKEAANEHKSKAISSKDRRKEQEMDKLKSRRSSADVEKHVNVKKQERKGKTKNEKCRGTKCRNPPLPGGVYCGDECIEAHVRHSVRLLHGEQVENVTERVVVLDRKTGKLITGALAPTVSNLLSWIQKHPSFEVLQPKQMPKRVLRSSTADENSSKSSKARLIKTSSATRNCDKSKKKKEEEPCPKSGFDSQRLSIRRNIQQTLLSKVTENVMMTTSEVKHLAIDLENELFGRHEAVDAFYRQHYRGLLKLLKHSSHEILNGEKSLDDFVKKALLEDDDILSTDGSTMKHDQHFYDINCQICNPSIAADSKKTKQQAEDKQPLLNKVLSPDVTSTTDLDNTDLSSVAGIKDDSLILGEEFQTNSCTTHVNDVHRKMSSSSSPSSSSCPSKAIDSESLVDRVWSGHMTMRDLVTIKLSAFRTSGSMKLIRKNFPQNLTIMGRIAEDVVVDYVRTMKTTFSSSKEVAVICFSCEKDETDEESYETLFNYLHSRHRCGVIGPVGPTIKDVYVWPLPSSSPVPSFLTPFNGPGLDVNRGNLLLGIIVQHCSATKEASVPFLLPNSVMESQKKTPETHNSSAEDDDDEGNEDEKDYNIITGAIGDGVSNNILKPDTCREDENNKTFGAEELAELSAQSSIVKNEDDRPYEPSDDCTGEEVAKQVPPVGSDEIQKKFDSLLEFLNKRPGPSASLTGTSARDESDRRSSNVGNSSQDSSEKSSRVSNCEAATAALASLNDFLEKFIARKRRQPIESSDVVGKNLSNFKLCEITNEQQQLMKQALEMVKAKSSKSRSGDSCSSVDRVLAPGNDDHFTSAKYSSPELLGPENRFIRQETTWNEVPYTPPVNLHPVMDHTNEQSWETSHLSRSSAIGNYWDGSKNFYQSPLGFVRGAREYNNQKRNFPPRCGSSRENVLSSHFCHPGGMPRSDRHRKAGNFSQFHEYRRMYNNNNNSSFGGWWRGRGR